MNKTNYRLRLDQSDLIRKNLNEFQNATLKNIASKLVAGNSNAGSWLKAHGDVSWGKAAQEA